MVAVVSWMALAWAAVEDSFWVAAASTSAEEVESCSAASRISVTKRLSVSMTWPMPATSGVSAASVTPSRSSPERSPCTTSLTMASMASSTPCGDGLDPRRGSRGTSPSMWSEAALTASAIWRRPGVGEAVRVEPDVVLPLARARATAAASAGGVAAAAPGRRAALRAAAWGLAWRPSGGVAGLVGLSGRWRRAGGLASGLRRRGGAPLADQGGEIDEQGGGVVAAAPGR